MGFEIFPENDPGVPLSAPALGTHINIIWVTLGQMVRMASCIMILCVSGFKIHG